MPSRFFFAFLLVISIGGKAMAQETQQDPKIVALNQEIALLKVQIELQTQQLALAKATVGANANLAELAGVQQAVSSMKLPEGQPGTVKVAEGTKGTALLRSKVGLLTLLDECAATLQEKLPDGAVVITNAQLSKAYQSQTSLEAIIDQTSRLKIARDAASANLAVSSAESITEFAAAAYSLGFVLDTVNSLVKLFRVDRSIDVFSQDVEAAEMLGYLLEAKNNKFIADPETPAQGFGAFVKDLRGKLESLMIEVQYSEETAKLLADIAAAEKANPPEKATPPKRTQLPPTDAVIALKAQAEAAKSLLDALNPDAKPDAFWAFVQGQYIYKLITEHSRLMIVAKAQVLQITEKRWLSGERITSSAEMQIAYRIFEKDGRLRESAVLLKAPRPVRWNLDSLEQADFPAK